MQEHQLSVKSTITRKYDVNGRLVEKQVDKGGYRPLIWRYRRDAKSQLTGLETPEGERWAYRYDPCGRRISKRCINRDRPGTDFHWNGDQLCEEILVGADGTPLYENAIRWIYEPGSFTPLARHENGELHYAVTDTLGRIQELMREDGTLAWRGEQQLWGRETGRQKADAPACRLRFPGQYEDAESGLYYNRFRYYDADSGQYLCADPIGLAGGINLYQYAPDPLKWIDSLGIIGNKVKVYKDAPYHGTTDNSVKSRAPANGQAALDNAIQVKPTSPRRVGVDIPNNEIVVLDKTRSLSENVDEYHGHVRDWNALDNKQQSALIKLGKTTRKRKVCGG